MKTMAFASRNYKEMTREWLTLLFGFAFPSLLLFLLTLIQSNIPNEPFHIEQLTPGIALFSLSFISLFAGMLIASDRECSFLLRLFTTPLRSQHFILGYTLPLFLLALVQMTFCYLIAFFLGLPLSINIFWSTLTLLPAALLFIAIGLLAGSVCTTKQVGGICGAVLTNLCAWLSGAWFDVSLIGGWFEAVAYSLPFVHAVEASREALSGHLIDTLPHVGWVFLYAIGMSVMAVFTFKRRMRYV
ncbi:ABC transporter [Shouchella lehensis G1]|uniref:Transport permease protein n=2 Tax=Shouchella lehensis TaxID=300825 RepID=A0A060LZK5_9BACI|nr:ABC transporter [Shouchella lehensis G1]